MLLVMFAINSATCGKKHRRDSRQRHKTTALIQGTGLKVAPF